MRLERTWFAAEAHCLAEGGHLPSVHSKQEEEFLIKLSKGKAFWLGAFPNSNGTGWVWNDGTPWTYERSVGSAEPYTSCISMDNDFVWVKKFCDYIGVYGICKK